MFFIAILDETAASTISLSNLYHLHVKILHTPHNNQHSHRQNVYVNINDYDSHRQNVYVNIGRILAAAGKLIEGGHYAAGHVR